MGYNASAGLIATSGGVDGSYGDGTRNAIIKFQLSQGLVGDGIVGKGTWGRMAAIMAEDSNKDFTNLFMGNRVAITIFHANSLNDYYYHLTSGDLGRSFRVTS